jgi:hypothetical protein
MEHDQRMIIKFLSIFLSILSHDAFRFDHYPLATLSHLIGSIFSLHICLIALDFSAIDDIVSGSVCFNPNDYQTS